MVILGKETESFVEFSYTYFTIFVLKYTVDGDREGHIISTVASNGMQPSLTGLSWGR